MEPTEVKAARLASAIPTWQCDCREAARPADLVIHDHWRDHHRPHGHDRGADGNRDHHIKRVTSAEREQALFLLRRGAKSTGSNLPEGPKAESAVSHATPGSLRATLIAGLSEAAGSEDAEEESLSDLRAPTKTVRFVDRSGEPAGLRGG